MDGILEIINFLSERNFWSLKNISYSVIEYHV